MQMPVLVGVIVSIIFLIGFSEWFYHLAKGWREYVLDDIFLIYRLAGISVLSMVVMSGTFLGMAYFNECDEVVREGIFAKLNCREFDQIMVRAETFVFGKTAISESDL